jgi:hypothetical protein
MTSQIPGCREEEQAAGRAPASSQPAASRSSKAKAKKIRQKAKQQQQQQQQQQQKEQKLQRQAAHTSPRSSSHSAASGLSPQLAVAAVTPQCEDRAARAPGSASACTAAVPMPQLAEQHDSRLADDGGEAEFLALLGELGLGAAAGASAMAPSSAALQQPERAAAVAQSSQPPLCAGVQRSMAAPPAAADDDSCVMCLDAPREVVLVPCGHMVLCMVCSQRLFGGQGREPCCPICRAGVVQWVRLHIV